MTIFYRKLSEIRIEEVIDNGLKIDYIDLIKEAFYKPEEVVETISKKWNIWFENYENRLKKESLSDLSRKEKMNAVNPKYVLRNYMAQLVIDAADKGEYELLNEIFTLLKNPYSEQKENQKWFAKRPEWARHKVGCSMLSCSS
jgi:uncharacterized protein YdiU (UPF0061 family)